MLEVHQQQEDGIDAPWSAFRCGQPSSQITGPHIYVYLTLQEHILLQLLWCLSASTLNPHLDDISFTPLATGLISDWP